jgi:hypothetical protein
VPGKENADGRSLRRAGKENADGRSLRRAGKGIHHMSDIVDGAAARNSFSTGMKGRTGGGVVMNVANVIPLRRPHIERECDGEGWYCILGDHGWLCGDRRQALHEFGDLVRIDCTDSSHRGNS